VLLQNAFKYLGSPALFAVFLIQRIFMEFNNKEIVFESLIIFLGLHRWNLIYGGGGLNFEFRTGILGHNEAKTCLGLSYISFA
jgi:hypothetical protein